MEGQAGYAAEGEANSTDEKLARTYAGTICKPSAVKAFLEFARQQAREILQAHWGAVLDLAEALDRRGTLSGHEMIDEILATPSVRPSKPRKWPAVSTCSMPQIKDSKTLAAAGAETIVGLSKPVHSHNGNGRSALPARRAIRRPSNHFQCAWNLRSVRLLQAAAAGSRNPRNQTLTLRSINNGDADLAARSDFRPKSLSANRRIGQKRHLDAAMTQ